MNTLILVAGGTSSGKTYFSEKLANRIGNAPIISTDRYYKDLSHLPLEERKKINFDDPNSIDWGMMEENIIDLLNGKEIMAPTHDYVNHTMGKKERIKAKKYIIVEGIFALYEERIRKLSYLNIYIDSPPDLRLLRRMKRDVSERGRTIDEVYSRWIRDVMPSHKRYVEPTKEHAHIIVPEDPENKWRKKAIELISAGLSKIL